MPPPLPCQGVPLTTRPAGREEAGAGEAVHQLHERGGLERREREQEQEGGDELGPDEERHAHPAHALGAELDDGGDEIDAAEKRRGDVERHRDDPDRLAGQPHRPHEMEIMAPEDRVLRLIGNGGQRRVGGPARLGRAARNEEAAEHQDRADEEENDAAHVQAGEGHVDRADLQRHDEIAEGGKGDGDDAEEHHDRAVHGAERVVEIAAS